jgi:hypothetical protein
VQLFRNTGLLAASWIEQSAVSSYEAPKQLKPAEPNRRSRSFPYTRDPPEEHSLSPKLGAIQWSQGITDAWSKVANFVPKFIGCLIILVVGHLIAKTASKIVDKALERVGFDKAVERGGVKKALEKTQYDASDMVAKVVFYAIFLIVLQMAFGVFGPNPVSDLLAGVIAYLPKVAAAIVIVVVATAIAAAAKELVEVSLGGLDFAKTVAGIAGGAIVTVGFFAALNQLQIAPAIVNGLFYAVLAVIAGSALIAIGGGGIKPMQQRWEKALGRWDEERPKLAQEAQGAKERVAGRAQELKEKAGAEGSGSSDRIETTQWSPRR